MAEIKPFRGIRYNDGRYADLSPVLAPPYDVISPADYKALRERSDRNVVRLTLRDSRLTDPPDGPAAYAQAAELLEEWLFDETLVQCPAPAVYLLDQEFEVNGEPKVRRAVIVRLRVEEFGKGDVFPHEQTMPGPKADRLALMKATKMNMSQVFGLYRDDDDGTATGILDQMAGLDPVGQGTGIDGVRNTLRAVYHPRLIGQLAAILADKRIIIADGHHRYETAVAYRDEMRPHHKVPTFNEPYEFVAAALVATSDPGLVIHPTHRLVTVKPFKSEAMIQQAGEEFELESVPAEAPAMLARLAQLSERHAFGIVTREGAHILIRKTGRHEADGVVARLDTHILHHEILAGLLGMGPESWVKGGPVKYVQSAAECIEAVQGGKAQLAALVNPTPMAEVEAIAFAGGKMPPKSTFFYPKIPTGTVINPLI